MTSAEAAVATESPARYLGQLVKHFAHKLPTTLAEDNTAGHIAFPMGPCDLSVRGETLVMRVEAETADDCAKLQDIVARHLLRFAFRSPPEIAWT